MKARISALLQYYFGALVVLLLFLLLTAGAYFFLRHQAQQRRQQLFEDKVGHARERIKRRLDHYIQILKGSKGLLASSHQVSRQDWKNYIEALEVHKSLGGIQGIGFAQVVPAAELETHQRRIRAQGYPDYRLRPAGKRPVYTAIVFLEPFTGRNLRAFGYDMFSEPVRRQAMAAARDSGLPRLTGKVKLVQETSRDVQPGFLIYLPVYHSDTLPATVAERRRQLRGYVYSPFRTYDLMASLFHSYYDDINIEIFDGASLAPDNLLYAKADEKAGSLPKPQKTQTSDLQFTSRLNFAGHTWTLRFSSLPDFGDAEDTLANWVLAGGLLISGLMFLVLWSQANSRHVNRLKQIITDNSTAALFMVDEAGVCTFMNPAATAMTGYSFAEIRLKPLHDLIHHHRPDGSPFPKEACSLHQAINSRDSIRNREDVFIRKDGSFFYVSCALNPIVVNQVTVAMVMEVRDISDRKEDERKLKENTELLKQTNRELRQTNNDLDNFVYTASHDLKAPIANVEGLIQELEHTLQGRLDQEDQHLLLLLTDSVNKLKQTIMDLTEITKVHKSLEESGESISFSTIFQDVQQDLASMIAASGAQISTNFAVNQVHFARKNLRSILYNLVSNALKYRSPERPLHIALSTHRQDGEVCLQVADNGLGIRTDQHHKLFSMFKRVHTHVEGSGIGLYIIKRILENNGGRIRLQSEVGVGTVFSVYFPENTKAGTIS